MDIAAWLDGLGLGQYEQAFRDNEIDERVLPSLTADDLKDLGVKLVGHRRRLLDAIAALGASAPVVAAAVVRDDASPRSDAERRQLTVMFCDLVGSTALSARLDPEDLREVIGAYHKCVADTIGRFDGFVAKYMGDGVLAYFGYPHAHEDDAERAVRAGLAVVQAVAALDTSEEVRVRIGLGTGLAVVGDLIGSGAAQEQAVIGETPNLAARLQALAGPDEIVIPENTRRLVGNLFGYESLGEVEVKGFAAPVKAFRVLRESGIGSRFEALRTGETPLIGRDEELELLRRRWTQAKAGKGQVVLISAEPGIGKSRLAEAFRLSLESEPHTRLRYFCSPHHQDSALFPFIAQLERAAGFERDDVPSVRLEKLEALVAANAPSEEDVQLVAEPLSVRLDGRYPDLNLTPQRKKEKTFEALLRQLAGLARRQPVLMIFEDLHWADPSSRELLDLTVEQIERLPALLIATFRPEFQPPWTGQPHVMALSLRRLARDESEELVRGLTGNSAALSNELLDEIIDRTDGVPLFLEELTKAVLESANPGAQITATPPRSLAVPATLHASLMARLDRLGLAAKEVAQVGAAIGREFAYDVLAVTARRSDAELQAAVARLVDAGLVFQRGQPPQATFVFKHALVRDAAHSTLLRGAQQRLHAWIADALETHSPEMTDSQPELFAQHYAEAGLNEKAVDYWVRAGKRSVSRSAMREAETQFEKALARVLLLPETHERALKELELQSSLGSVRLAISGFTASHVDQTYARARELWEQLGCPPEYLRVPWGQVMYHVNRGDLARTRRLAESLLALGEARRDDSALLPGQLIIGGVALCSGEFLASRSYLEEAHKIYNPALRSTYIQTLGIDSHIMVLGFLSLALLFLGYPDQALARRREAIAEGREGNHRPSLAIALSTTARLLACLGDLRLLAQSADELVALATEQGFPYWLPQGAMYQGWLKVRNGEIERGLAQLREGATAFRAIGAELWTPIHYALVAQAEAIRGHADVALTILDDALRSSRARGENWFEAELVRRKGELLRNCDPAMAETLFREALDIGARQVAKFWELRAAMSLARFRRDQGGRAEARDLLAPIYGWFTEGFGTPDLREAKALLDELG